jgi:hypothetical protein
MPYSQHSHMFDKDFRQILHASLKMYNGTDAAVGRGVNDKVGGRDSDAMLVKTAWDKLMIEASQKLFYNNFLIYMQKSCCGVDSRVGEFSQSGWYQVGKMNLYDVG